MIGVLTAILLGFTAGERVYVDAGHKHVGIVRQIRDSQEWFWDAKGGKWVQYTVESDWVTWFDSAGHLQRAWFYSGELESVK